MGAVGYVLCRVLCRAVQWCAAQCHQCGLHLQDIHGQDCNTNVSNPSPAVLAGMQLHLYIYICTSISVLLYLYNYICMAAS